jgi:DNA polymerase IV
MHDAMNRRILHIDMDAFFASVETVLHPEYRGKALIVGGSKDSRGVVSTCSYEARKFGVHSAMPIAQAQRLCPHGIYIGVNMELYVAESRNVRAILETVSPVVQFASIDEAYVDITGSQKLFGGDDAIAAHIKDSIRAETQLPCTVGIASNKLVAKIATEEAKPDGYKSVASGEEAAFLAPLPIKKLPGAGPKTREMLAKFGVATIGDLAMLPEAQLLRAFGENGYNFHRAARGESTSPVDPDAAAKSISKETTFETDRTDWDGIEQTLLSLAERVTFNLREKGMETRCVTLKIRYHDFKLNTFAKTLPEPTTLDGEVIAALHELIPKARSRSAPVRLIGVSLSSLSFDQQQLALFDARDNTKWTQLFSSVDRIRGRHGFESIRSAKTLGPLIKKTVESPREAD